ncbi:hypothetical protein [Roseateles sp.]|uniref:hypothetical protein n=1 Tax=Roseateles sp. TaxID=1971397 RepID=UPI0032630758
MKIDSTVAPTGKRLGGTLHLPGHITPAPSRDDKLPIEQTEESEVPDRHKSSGQKHPEDIEESEVQKDHIG